MSVGNAGPYVASDTHVDLDWLSDGWTLFGKQAIVWILAVLIAWGIDAAVSGILDSLFGSNHQTIISHHTHPRLSHVMDLFTAVGGIGGILVELIVDAFLCAGLCRMALRQASGETISLADMFKAGDILLPITATMAISAVLVVLGYCLFLVPGMVLAGLLMFAPFYVIADGVGPIEAISRSFERLKGDWFMAGFFHIVAGILVTLSFALCCVGQFAVIPQLFLAVAAGFLRFRGEFLPQRSPAYLANTAGAWPPAPNQAPPIYGANQPYGYAQQPYPPTWGSTPQGTKDMVTPPNPASQSGYGAPSQNPSYPTPGSVTSSGSGRRRTTTPRQPREPWSGASKSSYSTQAQDQTSSS